MIGLDIFAEHFKQFNDQYIVIGGAACDDHFKEQGLEFHATKDIDLILVVEAHSSLIFGNLLFRESTGKMKSLRKSSSTVL